MRSITATGTLAGSTSLQPGESLSTRVECV